MSDEIVKVDYDTVAMSDLAAFFIKESLENPRTNDKIRASMVGHCPRKIAHSILGSQPQPSNSHSQFTFFAGHALGDAMTFKLIKMGWVDATPFINSEGDLDWHGDTEEEVEDKYFKGHYDIFTRPLKKIKKKDKNGNIVETYIPTTKEDGGKRYLLDFKTMSDRHTPNFEKNEDGTPVVEFEKTKSGFDYLIARGWKGMLGGAVWLGQFTKLEGIPKDYWEQLHVYARIKEADGVMLVVMGKDVDPNITYDDPSHLLNFPVKVFTSDGLCEETLKRLDEKAEYIYNYTNKKELPPIPEEYEIAVKNKRCRAWPCGWCEFNHLDFPDVFSLKPGIDEIHPIAIENLQIKEEFREK